MLKFSTLFIAFLLIFATAFADIPTPYKTFTLRNSQQMEMTVTNLGGRIMNLKVPNAQGVPTNVVVGFDQAAQYLSSTEPYFGALIGRVGNRIAKGQFTVDGQQFQLPINNGENSLHGGLQGFQNLTWEATQVNESTLELHLTHPDGAEGFQGNMEVKVTYTLTEENALEITYHATADKATPCNLTNHAFFNLNGEGSGSILNHRLRIPAKEYTPVDAGLIPLGKNAKVKGTPFDFTEAKTIGRDIEQKNDQLTNGMGYDHNFFLKKKKGKLTKMAEVMGDKSGIVMEVFSTERCLQFYSGNFMESKNTFASGAKDDFRTAFCLETQEFPDAVNQPNFKAFILTPGKVYSSKSIYKFRVK
ncbi:aldose epimerase family protein [Persicobacter psychrovividus]|uniref:Aldose 1-epimerase n=1 Tax=Persicobacter psychrovividus TaxID=387638 RepID=A0ABM7VIL0_9BACT|nr:aldose 1-epimerase [Persicobacter psychrovividus]